MFSRNFALCVLWLTFTARALASSDGSLELIVDCCRYQCGRIDKPLCINSDGLGKKEDQFSDLRITLENREFPSGEDPHDAYCMVNLYTLDYAMLNLTYFLDSRQPDDSVVIMDSVRVLPKQTADCIVEGDEMSQEKFKIFGASQRGQGLDLEALRRTSSIPLGHLNKFQLQNYRISPSRLFTIAVKVDALKSKGVSEFYASIVADKGTPGRNFFIILGCVVVLFVVGVPGSFLVYKRYFKKKRKNRPQRRPVVQFNVDRNAVHYQADGASASSLRSLETSNVRMTAPVNQRRRLSLTERIRKATQRKFDDLSEPVLPKHELLRKQEQMEGSERPISVVLPIQQTVECAYPGVEPGSERDSPPQTVERPLQSSRNRVVSHMVIHEDEIYDDGRAPSLLQVNSSSAAAIRSEAA